MLLQLPSVRRAEGRVDPAVSGGDPGPAAVSVPPHEEDAEETHLPELAAGRPARRSLLAERPENSGDRRCSHR